MASPTGSHLRGPVAQDEAVGLKWGWWFDSLTETKANSQEREAAAAHLDEQGLSRGSLVGRGRSFPGGVARAVAGEDQAGVVYVMGRCAILL